MAVSDSLNKIKEIASRYNINILEVENMENVKYRCPFNFNVGIIDSNLVTLKGVAENDICVLIHELGHCVFDNSKDFKAADEFPWLIWEYMFAVEANIVKAWDKANCNYMTEKDLDWGILGVEEKKESLRKSHSEFLNLHDDSILMNDVLEAIEDFEWLIKD